MGKKIFQIWFWYQQIRARFSFISVKTVFSDYNFYAQLSIKG